MSVFLIKSIDGFFEEMDLLHLFKNLHPKGWNRLMLGDPYISLEKVIEDGSRKYYIAVPKNYESLLVNDPHVEKFDGEVIPKQGNWEALQVLARHSHKEKGIFETNIKTLNNQNPKMAFDFSSRFFKNNKRVRISFSDLRDTMLK